MSTPLSHSTSKRECQLPFTRKRECQLPFHTPHRRGNVNSPFTLHIEEGMSTPLSTHISHKIENIYSRFYPHFTLHRECLLPLLVTLCTELGMSTHLHFLSILTPITQLHRWPSPQPMLPGSSGSPRKAKVFKSHGLPDTCFFKTSTGTVTKQLHTSFQNPIRTFARAAK